MASSTSRVLVVQVSQTHFGTEPPEELVRSLSRLFRNYIPLDSGPINGLQIETVLDVQPVLRRGAEKTSESRRRIGRDSSFSIHNQADPVGRYSNGFGETIDADVFILQILL